MLFYIVYVKLIYYENKWVLNKLYCDKLIESMMFNEGYYINIYKII